MNRNALLLFSVFLAMPARAEELPQTLPEALLRAYRNNPNLRGQQATQEATNETAVQARTGWRPTVSLRVDSGYNREPFDVQYADGSIETNDAEAALTVSQPLYTGGRVLSAVRGADARIRAGEQGLRLIEAQTFQLVVGAYMDVVRDQQTLEVRRADLETLGRQVAETTARFNLGDNVTRTDVAQAEAQRQETASSLAYAEAALVADRAAFETVVGVPPGRISQPEGLAGLPRTVDEALARSQVANPALLQSRLSESASDADVDNARSGAFPNIGLQGSFGYIGPASPFHTYNYDLETSVVVTLTQPLVTGGLVASQVRQASARREAARQAVLAASLQARQDVVTAWARMQATEVATAVSKRQVAAATTALRGYQIEYRYGLRSTLDVLIADENLRAAQVSLVGARHDTVVAEAALLAATGDLEARVLLPDEPRSNSPADSRRLRRIGAVPWEGIVATLDRGGG